MLSKRNPIYKQLCEYILYCFLINVVFKLLVNHHNLLLLTWKCGCVLISDPSPPKTLTPINNLIIKKDILLPS